MHDLSLKTSQSRFDLKFVPVELIPQPQSSVGQMTVSALEAIRTRRPAVPASKSGLESICGASCDTAAH
ncbi:MAG TPA: hypothetical protein VKP66_15775 [Steroidobacteraceae bacterium]|nr:hypothetical protein [Steroidobacteraceae bacterium]